MADLLHQLEWGEVLASKVLTNLVGTGVSLDGCLHSPPSSASLEALSVALPREASYQPLAELC